MADEWVDFPITGAAGSDEWVDVDLGFVRPPPPKPNIVGEFGRGVARGAMNYGLYPIEEAANYLERKAGELTGSEYIQQTASQDAVALARRRAEFNQEYAPSVPSVTDIGSAGDALRYGAGVIGEAIPMAAGYMTPGGIPRMIALGAMGGADRAAKEYNGDPAAALVGAAVGAAAAGAPVPFIMGAAGQGLLKHAARSVLGIGASEVAESFAEPLAGVAAGQGYIPPTPQQIADAAVAGGLMGGVFGAAGGMRRGTREPMEVTTGVAPDVQVALNDTLQIAPPLRQLPPPAMQSPTLALPSPETVYGEGFTARPTLPEQGPLMLPPPETGYGEGFTVPPPYTPAVPIDPQLTGPARYPALEAPDLARGTQGEGFTVQRPVAGNDSEPARPSGGMNRGRLVEELTSLGHDPKPLRRMKIGELRDTYDQAVAQSQAAVHEFRPTTTAVVDADPAPRADIPVVPVEVAAPVARSVDTSTDQTSEAAAAPASASRPETPPQTLTDNLSTELLNRQTVDQPMAALMTTAPQTVADRLRAKRQLEKDRMAAPRLVKRAEVKPAAPEIKIEEDVEDTPSAEVESQPQVYESDAGVATVVKTEPAAEQARSIKTTNKDRILADLESKVANKLLTATEADQEYGRNERVAGRQRRYPDFASYLRDRIEKAPQEERRLLDEATRIEASRTIPASKRQAQVREITAKLERNSPEHIEKLRDALRELEDVESVPDETQAARVQAAKSKVQDKLAAIRAKNQGKSRDSVAGLLRYPKIDERLTRSVRSLLDKSDAEVESHSVHDYLDAISSDPVLKVRRPQDVVLARWLRSVLPAELQVMSQKTAAELYDDKSLIKPGIQGSYYYDPDVRDFESESIVINNNLDPRHDSVTTLLHESMHAVTSHYLDALPENAPAHQALREIGSELRRYITEGGYGSGSRDAKTVLYALTNPHELHTMLMTDPVLQRIAAEAVPSPDFSSRMEKTGFSTGPVRSMWRAFTGWVRRLVGLPQTVSDSLLDRIMRPLQDIADQAADYSRAIMPENSELRSAAEPTHAAASRALPVLDAGKLKESAFVKLDPRGRGDRMRKIWLQLATTDSIVTRFRDLFKTEDGNPLENYRAAAEAEQARTRQLRDEHSNTVNKLLDGMAKLDVADRDKLASLMNDATLAEVHLGSDVDNSHLTKPEQQAEARKLQARYNSLPAEAKELYNGWRDYYRTTYDTERKAGLASLIQATLPGATKAQVAALTEAARTRRGIQQLINNPDKSPVAAAFTQAWHYKRALVREIAKAHNLGFVQGDYFPLRRYGDYVIHYGDKNTDSYGVEMFERYSEAEARRDELVKLGVEPSQVLDKRESGTRAVVPETMLDSINDALRKAEFSVDQRETVRDAFSAVLLQYAARSEATRSRMRRKGVKGASLHVEKTLAQDFLAFTSRVGFLDHGPDRAAALSAMRRHADFLGGFDQNPRDQVVASAIVKELERRSPSGDEATGTMSHRMRQFSSFGWVYSLMSPSQMVVNTLEAHANSTSLLGSRHGYGRTSLALTKAMRELAPKLVTTGARNTAKAIGDGLKAADWNLALAARDRLIAAGANRDAMIDLFNRLNNAGLIDHSMVREIQRIANPGANITKGWWGKFLDFEGAMHHAIDVTNKSAIAKAAYDLEMRRSGDHETAAKYAVEMARTAMPNYNLANKPRIATDKGVLGSYAAPLMQFKMAGFHTYAVMANLVKTSMHGASKQDKREAAMALAGMLATRSLLAGTITLVADPLRYIMGLYDWITGAERPHDYQADMRLWIANAFGPELGEIISRGVPHALGIDLQHRIGLDNMLNMPDLQSFDMEGYLVAVATALSGAAGQDALKMADGVRKITSGQVSKGIVDFIPVRMVRDMVKAGMLNEEGVTDSRGRTILPSEQLSEGDIIRQAAGFQPSRVSEFRERRGAILQTREETKTERGKILSRYVSADPDDRSDVLAEVRAYNTKNRGSPITRSHLIQAMKRQREMVRDSRTAGLRLPKRATPDLIERGAFANVQ